jgi:hypothetical protein
VTVIDRARRWLRSRGIGERRWIPEPGERHRHTELVRSRLPVDVPDAELPDDQRPGPEPATPRIP